MRLHDGFSSCGPEFNPGPGHVGFMVDKAESGHVFFLSAHSYFSYSCQTSATGASHPCVQSAGHMNLEPQLETRWTEGNEADFSDTLVLKYVHKTYQVNRSRSQP
jgi:hypothetical protein